MEPIELLQEKRDEYLRALQKSKESFEKKQIDEDTHITHLTNLEPKIATYTHAIRTLQIYG